MKRTPVSIRFTQQLINANDQVCFSALREWEFEQSLDGLAQSHPTEFTTTVFPSNPYADAIYRRVEDLRSFAEEAEQVALRMGVIAAAEYTLAYIEDVQRFRHSLVPVEGEDIQDDAEEEQLRIKIELWSGKSPAKGHFWTLGYLRLLRNHYAHLNDEPHSSFRKFVQSYGSHLNKFWDNGITDTHGIDFKALATQQLTPALTFGIMNVLRVSVQHIDAMVAGTISFATAAQYCLDRVFETPHNRTLASDRLISKVKGRLTSEWGMTTLSPSEIAAIEELTGGMIQ